MATSQHESSGLGAGPSLFGNSEGPQGSVTVDDASQAQPSGVNRAPCGAEQLMARNGGVEPQPTGSNQPFQGDQETTSSPQGADEPRQSVRGMKSSRLIVDTDLLISEVKKRPSVYDQQEDDYSDRTKKQRCWEEICAVLGTGLGGVYPAGEVPQGQRDPDSMEVPEGLLPEGAAPTKERSPGWFFPCEKETLHVL
ncbi:unnamed protein product [Staurois parvus]|uniref:MADF domain-containing protein n=1 Tax=Staurois parvus TaxID=386267 RepID=A0ABN9DQ34_9NEOB|nr:unnamed protein product [Staurois parvus]